MHKFSQISVMSVLLQVPEGSGMLCPAARHTTATSRGPDRNWGKGMVTYHYYPHFCHILVGNYLSVFYVLKILLFLL